MRKSIVSLCSTLVIAGGCVAPVGQSHDLEGVDGKADLHPAFEPEPGPLAEDLHVELVVEDGARGTRLELGELVLTVTRDPALPLEDGTPVRVEWRSGDYAVETSSSLHRRMDGEAEWRVELIPPSELEWELEPLLAAASASGADALEREYAYFPAIHPGYLIGTLAVGAAVVGGIGYGISLLF